MTDMEQPQMDPREAPGLSDPTNFKVSTFEVMVVSSDSSREIDTYTTAEKIPASMANYIKAAALLGNR